MPCQNSFDNAHRGIYHLILPSYDTLTLSTKRDPQLWIATLAERKANCDFPEKSWFRPKRFDDDPI